LSIGCSNSRLYAPRSVRVARERKRDDEEERVPSQPREYAARESALVTPPRRGSAEKKTTLDRDESLDRSSDSSEIAAIVSHLPHLRERKLRSNASQPRRTFESCSIFHNPRNNSRLEESLQKKTVSDERNRDSARSVRSIARFLRAARRVAAAPSAA